MEAEEPDSPSIPLPLMFTGKPIMMPNPQAEHQPLVMIPAINAVTHERMHLILHPVVLPMLKSFCKYVERSHPEALKIPKRGASIRPVPEWMHRAFRAAGNGKGRGRGKIDG